MADGDAGGDEGAGYVPGEHGLLHPLAHYYGDFVRQIMLGAAALILLASPFYNDTRLQLPFEIAGTVILVALAALTNPRKKGVIMADAIATGVGLTIYQTWALYGYDEGSAIAFVFREALAILFMVAFYFSLKTFRAMVLHKIGRRDSEFEFDDVSQTQKDVMVNFKHEEKHEHEPVSRVGD